MNILKYMAFIKTVEYGSFTKAAEKLSYSQSGISRMINDLEKEWNLSLLERDRSGVRLTSEGERLLPFAQSLCEEYGRLQSQVEELHGCKTGIIRIGTISSAAIHWLPNIIKQFRIDYPHIEYELLLGDYSEIESWIKEGRVDCGILKKPTLPEFETINLKSDRLLAVLPKGHPLNVYDKIPLQKLCAEPFLLLEKNGQSEISAILKEQKIIPNVKFTTWEDFSIMAMVESGLGVSILPELILQRTPYRLSIKELDIPFCRTLVLAMRGKDKLSLAAKRFLNYLDYR